MGVFRNRRGSRRGDNHSNVTPDPEEHGVRAPRVGVGERSHLTCVTGGCNRTATYIVKAGSQYKKVCQACMGYMESVGHWYVVRRIYL